MINYSIIVPHRNIPHLLCKLIDSVPARDDVELIVVDDCSDCPDMNFDEIEKHGKRLPHFYLIKGTINKGAGWAKNQGLRIANGKWITLLGADDYYHDCINECFDEFVDSDADEVFFKRDAYIIGTDKISNRCNYNNELIDQFEKDGDIIPMIIPSADGGKFFKHQIIKDNHIFFNEVFWSNDVVFNAKFAICVKNIAVSDKLMVCAGEAPYNLTKARSLKSQVCRLVEECKAVNIVKKKFGDYNMIYYWLFVCWMNVWKINHIVACLYLPRCVISGGSKFVSRCYHAKFAK